MRRFLGRVLLLGALLLGVLGGFTAQPASAAAEEIDIVTTTADPELSANSDSRLESSVAVTFVVLLIAASAAGPWLARTTAHELDRRLRPLPVRTDERGLRRLD